MKSERTRNVKSILRRAAPVLECLDRNKVDYTIWGSVGRGVPTTKSDLDLRVEAGQEELLETCGFQQTLQRQDTCGIYAMFELKDRKPADVEASIHYCNTSAESKYTYHPHVDEDVRNVLYCVTEALKNTDAKYKIATHPEGNLSPDRGFFGPWVKERCKPKSKS